MNDQFHNVYEDERRADAYDALEFPGTYWLAYRDLPSLIERHVRGRKALDFGCGTGRSTRFLKTLGFDSIGVDISERMLDRARARDPSGDYRLVPDGALPGLEDGSLNLVLSVFTFDNVPTDAKRLGLHHALGRLLAAGGRIVSLVSAPEIYVNEWVSFSTRDFPGNRSAQSGDEVKIVMLDVNDRRPVHDVLWTDEAYRSVFQRAGLEVVEQHRPLGRADEPHQWLSESTVSPWSIYVLQKEAK